jgi:hypothetical protein
MLVLVSFSALMAQDIFDFVPEDVGYFLILRGLRSTMEVLRDSTNFFGAYLGDDGFGAERAFYGIIDAAGYNAEVDTSFLKNALNNDILLVGEGIDLSLDDLLMFDPFYLLEKLKLTRNRVFIAWRTSNSFQLLKATAALLDMAIFVQPGETVNELRSSTGTLFYNAADDYLIIGGNKEAVTLALKTYAGEGGRLLESNGKGREVAEKSYDFTLAGYIDGDRFQLDLGLESTFSIENTVVFARPEGHTLTATIVQDTMFVDSEELQKMISLSDAKEVEASKATLGDYTVFFPCSSVETLRKELAHWFELDLEPYRELADFVVLLSRESTGNTRIYGDLVSETPRVTAVFTNRSSDTERLEGPLKEWGAVQSSYRGNRIYELENDFDTIYFIFSAETTVLTSLTPDEYYRLLSNAEILSSNTSYEFVRRLGMGNDLVHAFIDMKKVFRSLMGISVDSALLYQQTFVENGNMIHTLRFY